MADALAPGPGAGRSGAGEIAAYDEPLNLICSLENLHHLGLAHIPLNREVLRIARSTEDLDGVGRDLHRIVGRDHFRDGRLPTERPPKSRSRAAYKYVARADSTAAAMSASTNAKPSCSIMGLPNAGRCLA